MGRKRKLKSAANCTGAVVGLSPFLGGPGQIFVTSGHCFVFNPAGGALQYELTSPTQQALFGYSLSGLQDVNGDGRGDFVVSSTQDGVGGQVFIYSGAPVVR